VRRLVAVAALVAGAGCGGRPVAAPGPRTVAPPPPREVRAVTITDTGYHDETSIAVNPARPNEVIASYQVPATVAYSADSGRTWRAQPLPGVHDFQLAGDPVVTFDPNGTAYAVYIAFDRPDDYSYLGRAAHRNGIFLNRSDDGGATWRAQATPVVFQAEHPGIPFEDKPGFAARHNSVYVAWTEFRAAETVILFARSTDGGASFSTPKEISDHAGGPKDSVGATEGTDIAVGNDGTIYVVWSDSTGVLIDQSHDGGLTFGRDGLVARTPDIVFGIPGVARCNGYPSIAIDRATGRLYVEWVDKRSGEADVYLATSDDGGATWSAARDVTPPDPAGATDHFFAWLASDPITGALVTGYYAGTPAGVMRYRLAYSLDAGEHFRAVDWSTGSFAPGGEFLGDYTGVAVHDGRAFGVWTEANSDTTMGGDRVHVRRHGTWVVVGRARLPD